MAIVRKKKEREIIVLELKDAKPILDRKPAEDVVSNWAAVTKPNRRGSML